MEKNLEELLLIVNVNQDTKKYGQIDDLKAEYEKHEAEKGISTNIEFIDELTGGIFPGLTVISGFAGHGKTMWANSITYNCIRSGINVIYISLEVPVADILYQMVSIDSYLNQVKDNCNPIPHNSFKQKKLTEEQKEYAFDKIYKRFLEYTGKLYCISEWDYNTGSVKEMKKIFSEVEEQALKQTNKGIGLIIIDQLQLLKTCEDGRINSVRDVTSYWVNEIRKISLNYLDKEKSIPIILLSQINREGFKSVSRSKEKEDRRSKSKYTMGKLSYSTEKNYNLTNLSESSEIERGAQTVLAIYSDKDLVDDEKAQFAVLKCRNGQTSEKLNIYPMNREHYYVGINKLFDDNYEGKVSNIIGGCASIEFSEDEI